MTLYNTFALHVLAPSLDHMRGTRTTKCLNELEKSQWWSRERIEQLQSERLQQLMQHVYDSVPYYRHVMVNHGLIPSRIHSSQDLSRLPVLTKDIVRTQRDDLMAEGFSREELRLATTSGSTGTPLTFYGTHDDQVNHGSRTNSACPWEGRGSGQETRRHTWEDPMSTTKTGGA